MSLLDSESLFERDPDRRLRAKTDLMAQFKDGRISPGEKLPAERELSIKYAISRGTLRRVLEDLEGAGWIERRRGSGTFLKRMEAVPSVLDPINEDEKGLNPEEVMEARMLIEPLLARLIVSRATEHELDSLVRLVQASKEAATMAEFETLDNRLHRALAEVTKNRYLIRIVDGIHQARQGTAWSLLRRRGLDENRRRVYQADHERIVSALRERDPAAAEAAIVDHLSNVRRNLLLM